MITHKFQWKSIKIADPNFEVDCFSRGLLHVTWSRSGTSDSIDDGFVVLYYIFLKLLGYKVLAFAFPYYSEIFLE